MSPRPTGSGPVGSGVRPIRVARGSRRPWTRPTRPLDSWPSARTMPSWASRSLRWAPGATPATTLGSTRLTWTCRSRPKTACSISPVCGRTGKTVGSGPPSTSAGLSGLPIGAPPACSASRGTGPPPSAAACCSKSTISRGLPPSSATTPGRTVALTVPPVAAPARARPPSTGARNRSERPALRDVLSTPPSRFRRDLVGLCDGQGLSLGFKFFILLTPPTACPAACIANRTSKGVTQVFSCCGHGVIPDTMERSVNVGVPLEEKRLLT